MIWLLLGCVAAPVPQYPEVTAGLMARVDLDGDGEISAVEFEGLALPDEMMGAFDEDGDGVLSVVEVEAGRGRREAL